MDRRTNYNYYDVQQYHNFFLLHPRLQDGKQLLTGCNDKLLKIFSIDSSSTEQHMTLSGHTSAVKCAVWGRNSSSVLSSADEPELR